MIKTAKAYLLNICLGPLLLAFYITIFPKPLQAAEFIDTVNNWARVDIAHLQALQICSGYGDNRFRPDNRVTRAEFTKLLLYATGEEKEALALAKASDSYFADVSGTYWARGYIILAREMGLVKGQGDTFLPDAYISREEAACILDRLLSADRYGPEEVSAQFSDKEEFSSWAAEAIQSANRGGLITGFPDGSFRPHDYLTRAQAVALAARVMDRRGLLYQYNGVLTRVSASRVGIAIGGEVYDFPLAANCVFADKGYIITSLENIINNTRVSFNVNANGYIVFANFVYEDRYLHVNATQMEDVRLASTLPLEAGNITAAGQRAKEGGVAKADPRQSLELGKAAIAADTMAEQTGASGQGTIIAIIDSGVDPLNQNLQRTDNNSRKVIDWVNFTGEGRVITSSLATVSTSGRVMTSVGDIELPPNVSSASGKYHYGLWSEAWIAYTCDFDYTGNGSKDDSILVLLVDSRQPGQYDLVYVDTNNNHKLTDEVPLRVYREYKYSYATFPVTGDLRQGFPFVLCDIAPDGSEVSFGYDSDGHGTHVAGIAAANGEIRGVAPNAQIMVLKVADCSGSIDVKAVLRAVEYAVSKGANIINISLGFYNYGNEELQEFTEKINRLAEKTVICTATGNNGPGLSSLATPGAAQNTITVGAGMNPQLWDNNYGWEVGESGTWYFNSTGPVNNGGWKPDVLAPGSSWSCYPVWTGQKYYLDEGTSMAVPYVSGLAALLMDGMLQSGMGYNSLMIKEAIINSAIPRDNTSLVEQGHGMVNAQAAWEMLEKAPGLPKPLALEVKTLPESGPGIFERQFLPGISPVQIINNGVQDTELSWASQADWIHISRQNTIIPANSARQIDISYTIPQQSGLYSGLVEGLSTDGANRKIDILNTLIVPEKWDSGGEYSDYRQLAAGQMKRYFLDLPENGKKMNLKLKVMGTSSELQGRVRLYIYDAGGNLYKATEYVGVEANGAEAQREINVEIDQPMAGIWEIVVYSSPALSLYGLESSDYVFSGQVFKGPAGPEYIDMDFIIGCAFPKGSVTGSENGFIYINILKASSMKAYSGPLLINNRLYSVQDGQVKISGNVARESLDLVLRKIV